MKISVIVPVWNAEKYIERCVRSVQAQTHTDWELILVDDGSADSSGAICDAMASEDARIRVIHQANGGVSAARNTGLDAVTGDWICFCDNDDIMYPRQMEYLLAMCRNHQVSMAVCGFEEVAMNAPIPAAGAFRGDAAELLDPWQYMERLCTPLQVLYVVPWGKLYDRALFDTVRYPEGTLNEDDCVIHSLVLGAGRVAVSYEPLHGYGVNRDSVSRKGIPIVPWIRSLRYKEDRMQILRKNEKWSVLYKVQRLLFYDLLLERSRLPKTDKEHRQYLHRYAGRLWQQLCKNPAAGRKEVFLVMLPCLLQPETLARHDHEEFLQ